MGEKMRAAVLTGPGTIEVTEVERPDPGPDEVLLKVAACSVCATDVKKYIAGPSSVSCRVLGHEVSGIIVGKGGAVPDTVQTGSRAVVAPVIVCGECPACRSGLTMSEGCGNCEKYGVVGITRDGGFAEYLTVPYGSLYNVPEGLRLVEAALTEPVAACYSSVLRARARPFEPVGVIGGGFMGMTTARLFKLMGHKVILSEPLDARRKLARELGMDVTIDPTTEDLTARVKDATDGFGVGAVVAAIGNGAVIRQAANLLRPGGSLVLLASGPKGEKIEMDLNDTHYRQITLTGSVSYSYYAFSSSLQIIARDALPNRALLTHEFGLGDVATALEMTRALEGMKKVIIVDREIAF